MGNESLREWLNRTRQMEAPAEPEPPAPERVKPTPEGDARHLVALLAEGAQPLLVNGTLFLTGRVTARAEALFCEHGDAITRLVVAMAAGRVNRQALAAKLSAVDGWTWPGAADGPAKWPGHDAFLLGVEPVKCSDCERFERGTCARYGRMPPQTRPVRCLWALPRKRTVNGA